MKKALVVLMFVSVGILPAMADAAWGGGVLAGYQAFSYPFLDELGGWNNDQRLAFYGGYGYGVTESGFIRGGFGGLIDDSRKAYTGGIVGGVVLGKQFIAKPVSLSLMSWTGFGPISTTWGTETFSVDGETGFICLMQEIDIEVGIPVFTWFMPTFYAGVQIVGNILDWDTFNSFASYTPIFGIRLQLGKFNYALFGS
jgi:hypothetical protein